MAFLYISFNNSIGNITTPSFTDSSSGGKYGHVIVGVVYTIWYISIIFSLIILLNFVIALVSQVYENVMDAKLENIYK